MRPLDFLGRIKVKLGIVIVLAVVTAFVVNEVGINAGWSRDTRIAVAALLALIMVQLLAWGMTRPLREMAAAAQTIAKGRYGLRVTATSRDEVGELARAFNAMAADLAEVDRQRRELVANVSHELRTPITGLQAVLENVVDGVSPPDLDTLGTALAQTQRLGRLVAQLLDLSRLDSGARLIEPEELDLAVLCRQAASEAALGRDDVTVVSRVPDMALYADPALLAQVLANLLDNAVRHSPAGGTVRLETRTTATAVEISVTDSGPGIPPDERTRIFERFSRLDAGRAADAGGAGLGLAIAKEIVELHGGSIRVADKSSAPVRREDGRTGTGCRMVVSLPAASLVSQSAAYEDGTGEGAEGRERVDGGSHGDAMGGTSPGTPPGMACGLASGTATGDGAIGEGPDAGASGPSGPPGPPGSRGREASAGGPDGGPIWREREESRPEEGSADGLGTSLGRPAGAEGTSADDAGGPGAELAERGQEHGTGDVTAVDGWPAGSSSEDGRGDRDPDAEDVPEGIMRALDALSILARDARDARPHAGSPTGPPTGPSAGFPDVSRHVPGDDRELWRPAPSRGETEDPGVTGEYGDVRMRRRSAGGAALGAAIGMIVGVAAAVLVVLVFHRVLGDAVVLALPAFPFAGAVWGAALGSSSGARAARASAPVWAQTAVSPASQMSVARRPGTMTDSASEASAVSAVSAVSAASEVSAAWRPRAMTASAVSARPDSSSVRSAVRDDPASAQDGAEDGSAAQGSTATAHAAQGGTATAPARGAHGGVAPGGAARPDSASGAGSTGASHDELVPDAAPAGSGHGKPAQAGRAVADPTARTAAHSALHTSARATAPAAVQASAHEGPAAAHPAPHAAAGAPRAGGTTVGGPPYGPHAPHGPGGGGHHQGPPAYVPPPLFPRPELPETPKWLLPVAAAVGLVAAVALPYASTGLGLVLTAVVMGAAVLPAVIPAGRSRLTPWTVTLGLLAYALVSVALFRDADWLVAPALLLAFAIAALALSGGGTGWAATLRGGASVLLAVLPLPWFLSPPLRGLVRRRNMMPALLGTLLTVVLLGVFGVLFSSADAVFSSFAGELLKTPDWVGTLPFRVVLFGVFAVLVAAAVLVALKPVAEPAAPDLRMPLGRGVWVIPLAGLDLLFASFVAVQVSVLFGGNRRVLSTAGLTYAQYARSGFFELVTVSVFVLGIVAAAVMLLRLDRRRDRWLLAGLLGLLCAFTLVILASALHRLGLYTDAYGLSRLRAAVEAAIWWLGGVFVLVLVVGAVRLLGGGSAWFFRSLVLLTGVTMLVFAVWSPDARVAESQVSRGVARLDHGYLGALGAEAVPVLDRLPEPARSCVLREIVAVDGLSAPDGWNGWNLARARARDVLAERPLLGSPTCPATWSRVPGPGD
ncbi:hypothetical protein GCM10009530_15280 [Microbispora corallina]|uniref:Signal transduction histidine-protein kinase/phosphatase MprB n=1 Tax=Microbispora corallina TaxID=83302 RepID=A0ABQ4FXF7_9ACTN|nr:DUF4153 domain-containing protein [Microbispora corallina]GIH39486.1 hypothetical protein Mco01_24860 [Microbispora corallina]